MAETYGFVGIGHMGAPMAGRLLAAGHAVLIHDTSAAALEPLVALGAKAACSAEDVAQGAVTVFLSLPTPAIAKAVCLGPNGLCSGGAVRTVVDFSTIGQSAAVAIFEGLARRGIAYVDAPVSGGVPGARAGTLAIMVSCAGALYGELQQVLGIMGRPFHIGQQPGQAQTMKLANNLLAAAAIAVSSEAMVMGVKAGLDPQVMLDVINAGSGCNSATRDKFAGSVLSGTFDFGFSTGLSYKDIRLCIEEAEALGVPMVVGSAVREMLAITNSVHGASSDYTSMCRVVEAWAGVEVRAAPRPA